MDVNFISLHHTIHHLHTNHQMSTITASSSLPDSICANCGKGEESSGNLKACTACKLVKYCNRDCQIAHRPQHKKACKKRAAEIHDEAIFQERQREGECPICMLPLPLGSQVAEFYSCCGKYICMGCIYAMNESGADLCPFCRAPGFDDGFDEKEMKRINVLMEKGNADAFYFLAGYYREGSRGLPQDEAKANELYLKAGELGCAWDITTWASPITMEMVWTLIRRKLSTTMSWQLWMEVYMQGTILA